MEIIIIKPLLTLLPQTMAFVCSPITLQHKSTAALAHSSFLSSRWKPLAAVTPTFRQPLHNHIPPTCSDMGLTFPEKKYDEQLRIGIVSTRWNAKYVQALLETVKSTLDSKSISGDNIVHIQVPGAWELPMAARFMCAAQKVDAVICLGTLIKGETEHYEYIAGPVSTGLMDLQLTVQIPIIFGVLCCTTKEQAEMRSIGDGSHAEEWALTAIEMAQLRKSQMGGVSAGKKSVGFF